MEKDITVIDALVGVEFIVPHLDGTPLLVKHNPEKDGPIKPGDIKEIRHWGMPLPHHQKGSLFIKFNVIFPDKLNGKQIKVRAARI